MDPVIVVGAGPVGLTLSLALAAQGVPSVLLDEGPGTEEVRLARTVVLREDTADLVERLGATALEKDGLRWSGWRSMRRKQLVRDVPLGADAEDTESGEPDASPLPAPVHIPQHALASALRAAVAAQPLVKVAELSRVDTLEQDGDGVTVHTKGPDPTWWRGSYLVGCDGARSTVRKLLEIRFPGRTAVERHAVAALRAELPWPDRAVLHRQPPWRGGGAEISARPLPDGVWRLDWLLPPRGDLVTPDALVARIRDTLAGWCGETPPYELLDTGVHTLHHRLARRWRVRRAFLAGDAAHLLGALGTQGLDEGIRDAENLAWKLAHAWHHGGADPLLDSYQAERRAAVASRLRAADQSLPILRGGGGLRTLVPGAARGHDTLLADGHLGCGALGAPPSYSHSPLHHRTRRRTPLWVRPRCAGRRCTGDGTGRSSGTAPGAARAGPPAGDPGGARHRGVGPAPLADRGHHAAPGGGGGGAAVTGGAAGHGELSGGVGPYRAAGAARRASGGRLRGRTSRGAARGGPGGAGRIGGGGNGGGGDGLGIRVRFGVRRGRRRQA